MLAAADTFRAGAIDQQVVWGERAGVEVVRGNAGGDPAAVVYDAMERAKMTKWMFYWWTPQAVCKIKSI